MVDFTVSENQQQLVASAHEFGRDVLGPAEVALDRIADPDEVFKSDLFWGVMKQAYQLGFHKMALPERYGGLGLDPPTIGMIWEELGRWGPGIAASLIPGAIVPQLVAFLASDNKELVDRFVIPFCEDDAANLVTAWCSSEPAIGSDGKNYYDPTVHHHTTAVRTGGGYSITGAKSGFISNGGIARAFIVFACVDPSLGIRGSGTFVVPADAPGVSRGKPLDKIGLRALNQAEVFFDGVEIPETYQIFPPGESYPMLHHAIVTVGNLSVGYLAVGLMRAAFEEALTHARGRVQGGKPIVEHQLIAEKLFTCYQAIEAARAFLWKGSWLSKQSFPGDLKTSLAAKVFATEQAVHQTAEMIQVFGGYGISKEYKVEKYCRDATLLRIMDGTNETLLVEAAARL
jgi:alkylation response protein AidB-like acyl-CoA dehydrogenase